MKSSNDNFDQQDLIEIGKVIGAHGVRGAIRVYSYAESMVCFDPGTEIIVQDSGGAQRRFKIIKANPYKSIVRLTLKGVTSRNEAETLTGSTVWMLRANLPALEEDVFYWADLLGMDVFTVDDVHLGRITDIIPTGANDVYVVKSLESRTAKEILIPAIASVVLSVETDNRRMRVALPEGLIDL